MALLPRLGVVGVALAVALAATGAVHAGTAPTPRPEAYRDQPPLAYVSDGRVFVLDGEGGPPLRVRGARDACCVEFSPDGYYVAFQQGRDLWVAERDGAELHRVARAVKRWAWAPDGQALAVIPQTGPDVSGRTGIEFYGAGDSSISETLLPEYRVLDLAWAGFGRRIAVSAAPAGAAEGADANAQVFMLEVPGPYGADCPGLCPEDPLRVPVEHADGASGLVFAGWSPNVDAIAVWTAADNGATLGLVSPRGGEITPVADTLVRRSWVQWSRTGDRLLVVEGDARGAGAPRALLLCAAATGCRAITESGEPVADPAWSRAGSMAYVWTERRELWTANLDGADPRRLSNAGQGVHAPRWLPDGRHLVFVADRFLWLLDTTGGDPVAVAGPIGRDRETPAVPPRREPTDDSLGTRWEQLYSVAP